MSDEKGNQETEVVSDEVLEHIYSDLAELRTLLERNRAVIELTQQLLLELRTEVQVIQTALKLTN